MEKIGLFYGSDTGCTDDFTKDFIEIWGKEDLNVMEIGDASIGDFKEHKVLILGLSTWYDGDLQSDWETFFEDFQTIDFTGKIVAIYGLGDQIGYGEYFVDGIGILAEVILENGGTVIGHWPTKGYRFTDSVAIVNENENFFYGLAIDNDNESQLSDERSKKWIEQVKLELKTVLIKEHQLVI